MLAKLPDEHAVRAIRLDSEFEALERKASADPEPEPPGDDSPPAA